MTYANRASIADIFKRIRFTNDCDKVGPDCAFPNPVACVRHGLAVPRDLGHG